MKKLNKSIPNSPGIYLFKDATKKIIYIGKAKSLKNRVNSYFQKGRMDWKIASLLEEAEDIDFIVTKSETEAMLLEANLIQEYQPRYNVLFKDGQPFLYILFTNDDIPLIKIVRLKKEKGSYFGPFLHKSQARRVYNFLCTTFQLTLCKSKIPTGCLKYHLGFCPGNCKTDFDINDYKFRMQLAKDVLKNNHESFLKNLKHQITHHNELLEFEKSKQLTEYVENFETIFRTIKTHFSPEKYAEQVAAVTAPDRLKSEDRDTLAIELQKFLDHEKPIEVIDCFDISHFQSRYIVGSCIRFTNGIPEKNKFRRFKVRTLHQQNDYAALQEIVMRRYKNGDIPDLVLIDGGKGQLNAVKAVFGSAPCISLAKKEEIMFSSKHLNGVHLDVNTRIGKLLISLRDYAHHFAISYHRLKRAQIHDR